MNLAARRLVAWLLGAALVASSPPGIAAALWAAEAAPDTPEAHYAAGMEHRRAGRAQEALVEFRAAARLDRNHLPSLIEMADLLSSGDRVFEAYGVLQHATRIAPGSAEAHGLLGRCFSRLERLKDAREELQRAVELNPGLTEPYYGLAAVERRQGRLADARRHVETFLSRAPDDDAGKELRATLCLEMKDYDAALAAYRDLRKAQPDAARYARAIAQTFMAAGRYQEAEPSLRELLDRDPGDAEALRSLYECAYRRGAYQEAALALERLVKLGPTSCEPLLLLARSYHRLARFAEARESATRCLAIEPGHSGAHFLIGWTWLGEGDLEKAKAEFGGALRGDPSSIEALYWSATVELRLDRRPAAVRLLETAIRVDPEYASAHYELARAYAAEGRAGEAAKQFEEFRRLKSREAWKSPTGGAGGLARAVLAGPADAGHLEDWIGFATYLIGEKRPREALLILEPARAEAPANAEVMRLTAVARTEAGEIEEALAAYAEAERLGPTSLLYWGRGLLHHRSGDDAAADADLRRALAGELSGGQAAEAHLVLAALSSQDRRWAEAEAELRRSITLDPDSVPARLLLAETLVRRGKPADAALEARRVLDRSPRDVLARLALAQACLEQKRFDDADAEIARASEIDGESARVLLARGRLAAQQGRRDAAIDDLSRAGLADPSRSETFALLGAVLLEGGRASEAAVSFEKATIVDPRDAASWMGLGRIYSSAKRIPAAVGYFEKAVSAAPEDAEARYLLASALQQAGRVGEAEDAARRAKALGHPGADALLQSLAAGKKP
jgi:tetratricopeptide (TPR) repeat protein